MTLVGPSGGKQTKIKNKKKSDIEKLDSDVSKFLDGFDAVNDTRNLYLLLYQSDRYYDTSDHSLEVSVDKHLAARAQQIGIGNSKEWKSNTGDTHLLMAWLEKFRPKV